MKKIVVMLALIQILSSCSKKPEKQTYLIPSNFVGQFRVVYGEKFGTISTLENGRRLMVVPENGLLIVHQPFVAGTIDNEYYMVDSVGKRTRLNELFEINRTYTNSPGATLSSNGTFSGKMPDGSFSADASLAINYEDFFVFKRDTTLNEDQYSKSIDHFDSLTNIIVDNYRKMK